MTPGVAIQPLRPIHRVALTIGLICLSGCSAAAEHSLKIIDNPGGGRVVYGPVQQSTPHAAMATVLHYVHTHFGQTPANPDRFEAVPTANFLEGVDF